MSVVTGIMLLLGAGDWDEEPIREVQAWLDANWHGNQLREVADEAGGRKHPQFEAWCAGINFLDEDMFVEFVLGREWRAPEHMVLIIKPEEGPVRVFLQQRKYEGTPEIIVRHMGEPVYDPQFSHQSAPANGSSRAP